MVFIPKAIYNGVYSRSFSTSKKQFVKVAVLGASGGIGQPLSLLLKLCPLVTDLSLYDLDHSPGVATDLSHINRNSVTRGVKGPEMLKEALTGVEVVAISAGVPRKPGMTRDDLFDKNASLVRDMAEAISKYCPKAIVAFLTNPLNSAIPIAAETLKKNGVFDPNKLMGVTTLDLIRASTFLGELKGIDPMSITMPVIGGHSGETIVPILSQCKPCIPLDDCEVTSLTKRIQEAGTEVVKAKAGAGSATLSTAYAAYRLVNAVMRGVLGEPNVIECAYVSSSVSEVSYFSTPLVFGCSGIERNLGIPPLCPYETELLKKSYPILKKNITKGEDFILKGHKECNK